MLNEKKKFLFFRLGERYNQKARQTEKAGRKSANLGQMSVGKSPPSDQTAIDVATNGANII